ncbi:MAG: hypothetical protein WCS43_16060, partial [Verrucomicrobiota bacterium]
MKTRIASVLLSVGLMSAGFFALRPDKVTDPPRPPQSFMPGVPASQTVVAAAPLAASNIPVEEQDRTDCGVTSSGQAIPWDQLGAKAGQQYSGNGLGVIPTATGATVRCIFQKMEGNATPEGLWLTSTADDSLGERFRVRAMAIGRADTLVRLSNEGEVQVRDGTAAYLRRGLTEEYSATMDGVRQDFLIAAAPAGEGALRLMLDVTGASGATAADGATLTLDGSGRAIAYSRLRVTDATGRELTARMEAPCGQLAVVVEDTNAAYPIRIDPTFSDANWVSMNPSISGPSGLVQACVADASGSLYIGGDFRCAGSVNAYYIAKWNGSTWSALGSGVNSIVYALALDGSGNLYAAGSFTTADGLPANRIAKWNGSTWSALGSGMDSTVRALALDGSGNLYAAGSFTTADGLPANRI